MCGSITSAWLDRSTRSSTSSWTAKPSSARPALTIAMPLNRYASCSRNASPQRRATSTERASKSRASSYDRSHQRLIPSCDSALASTRRSPTATAISKARPVWNSSSSCSRPGRPASRRAPAHTSTSAHPESPARRPAARCSPATSRACTAATRDRPRSAAPARCHRPSARCWIAWRCHGSSRSNRTRSENCPSTACSCRLYDSERRTHSSTRPSNTDRLPIARGQQPGADVAQRLEHRVRRVGTLPRRTATARCRTAAGSRHRCRRRRPATRSAPRPSGPAPPTSPRTQHGTPGRAPTTPPRSAGSISVTSVEIVWASTSTGGTERDRSATRRIPSGSPPTARHELRGELGVDVRPRCPQRQQLAQQHHRRRRLDLVRARPRRQRQRTDVFGHRLDRQGHPARHHQPDLRRRPPHGGDEVDRHRRVRLRVVDHHEPAGVAPDPAGDLGRQVRPGERDVAQVDPRHVEPTGTERGGRPRPRAGSCPHQVHRRRPRAGCAGAPPRRARSTRHGRWTDRAPAGAAGTRRAHRCPAPAATTARSRGRPAGCVGDPRSAPGPGCRRAGGAPAGTSPARRELRLCSAWARISNDHRRSRNGSASTSPTATRSASDIRPSAISASTNSSSTSSLASAS